MFRNALIAKRTTTFSGGVAAGNTGTPQSVLIYLMPPLIIARLAL
jgi:hypothetical protein